ncbi:MAG: hypothetical protein WAP23_02980, partial [Candidatus Spechtbacterales bacterium]
MARDLERAKGNPSPQTPPPPPKEAEVRGRVTESASHEELKLKDILAQARLRIQKPKEITKPPTPPQIRKILEDILPIEPPSYARPSPASHGAEPPSNLPTGESSFISNPPALPAGGPVGTGQERAKTEEKIKRTPEEILGLADRQAGLP